MGNSTTSNCKRLDSTVFTTGIHTMQIEQEFDKIDNIDGSIGAKFLRFTKGNRVAFKTNVNNKPNPELSVKTLSEHKVKMELVYSDIGTTAEGLIHNRVDIAIDSDIDFNENLKYFSYLFDLLIYPAKTKNNIEFIDHNTLEHNALSSRQNRFELMVYDKAKESKMSKFSTRMEFRYKRLESPNYETPFKKLLDRIGCMESNIVPLNDFCIERICRHYDKEIKRNKALKLTTFAVIYDRYIFTYEILKGLYKHSGLKTPLKQWLNDIRKSRGIEYFNKATIKQFQVKVIRSIKSFKNG